MTDQELTRRTSRCEIAVRNSIGKNDNSFSANWSRGVLVLHQPILASVKGIAHFAAKFPKLVVTVSVVLSLLIAGIGVNTNFVVESATKSLWTPEGSKVEQHMIWLNEQSGFPSDPLQTHITVHANGRNVLGVDGVQHVFEALDTVYETPGFYDEICPPGDDNSCETIGITKFWNHTSSVFETQVASSDDLIRQLSASTYPDGTPVDRPSVMGNSELDENGNLSFVQMYILTINNPAGEHVEEWEVPMIERVLALKDAWESNSEHPFVLELFSLRAYAIESVRSIANDVPLVPAGFLIMSVFTGLVFLKHDWVKSRSLLGFGAVASTLLSIIAGYGLLFVIGVPFTSITQILTFVMFGIGLDHAFIIMGAFSRTDPKKEIVDRIDDTMDDIGVSIALTAATSTLAFGVGCVSTIPGVKWLCFYAFPTVAIDFLYQITFFVALIAIDEKRVQDKRRDCLVCCAARRDDDTMEAAPERDEDIQDKQEGSAFERLMIKYSNRLLQPWVKRVVLFAFTGLLAGGAYSASQLTQQFSFVDVLTADSYVRSFWDVFDLYSSRVVFSQRIYFRDVDQSAKEVQRQMYGYVDELVNLEQVKNPPPFFWLRDFDAFVQSYPALQALDFNDQVAAFLNIPEYAKLYGGDMVLDEDGNVVESRTTMYMSNLDAHSVSDTIEALADQRMVTKTQPINKDKSDWSFFAYGSTFNMWEFYTVAVKELILTTIFGVVSISALALFIVPHWTAVLYVAPMISALYVELLGVLNLAGFHINAVSYVCMVMSIGLMVDFIMHVLLRFYEVPGTREERTREVLRTMGSSVLIGALSTFLGVLPLALSSNEIFQMTFTIFIGMVILGGGHGLILLPVLLSMIGPTDLIVAGHDVVSDETKKETKLPETSGE